VTTSNVLFSHACAHRENLQCFSLSYWLLLTLTGIIQVEPIKIAPL